MAAKDIFAAIGLGTPFYFAAATYSLFFWLDRNASGPANRAISGWLKGQPRTRIDVSTAIVAAFDRIYSYPLLRTRAFLRSATVSIIAIGLMCVASGYISIAPGKISYYVQEASLFTLLFAIFYAIVQIISDYISLFIVRRLLFFRHPLISLLTGVIVGVLVVGTIFAIVIALASVFAGPVIGRVFLMEIVITWMVALIALLNMPIIILSAFFVHVWLLLFALGALGVRFIYPVFRAVEWAQWFLKQGNQHPLRAIGMVAGVLVFAGTAIARLLASIT